MRVLVTGNLGYLGTIVAPLLADRNHLVEGMDSGLFRGCETEEMPELPTVPMDVRDVEAADLDGVEAVVQLAGLSNDPLGALDPGLTDEVNRRAAVRLGRLARRAGARRFLFASSCSVYGAGGDDPLTERSPCRPLTAYAEAKAGAERELMGLSGEGFAVTALRLATAYGASPMIRFDLVLNNLVAWAAATGAVHLKSDGMAWRPLVHVGDIARAIVAVLEAPRAQVAGRAINVAAPGENHRVAGIARLVARTVPGSALSFAADGEADRRSYRVDCERLASLDGFRPQWDARGGAKEMLDAVERLRPTVEEFEGPRYNRLARILKLREEGVLGEDLRWTHAPARIP
jgi:nucleoside-diphosphate-sugar epimerase